MKDNINCPFDKISGYPEYADTKEHSGYVYVEKYTLHGDTYYVAKGRSNLSLKREGDIGNSLDIEPLSMIPEFNPDHFGVSKRYDYYWWPIDDYHSRIKAFDKLISEYRLNK